VVNYLLDFPWKSCETNITSRWRMTFSPSVRAVQISINCKDANRGFRAKELKPSVIRCGSEGLSVKKKHSRRQFLRGLEKL